MKIKNLIFASIIMIAFIGCSKKINTKAISLSNMDTSIKPGNNFYFYANGEYLKTLEIPEDRSTYNVFNVLEEKRDNDIHNILEEVSKIKNAEYGSATQKVRDFYLTGMDVEKTNAEGIDPLLPEFEKINNIQNMDDFLDVVVYMHLHGIYPFFMGGG